MDESQGIIDSYDFKEKVGSLIKTGLRLQTDALHEALENRQREVYNDYRGALDRYTLLNDWLFTLSEKVVQPKSKTSTEKETTSSKSSWQQQWLSLRSEYLTILKTLVGLDLNRLWTVKTELHTFIK